VPTASDTPGPPFVSNLKVTSQTFAPPGNSPNAESAQNALFFRIGLSFNLVARARTCGSLKEDG